MVLDDESGTSVASIPASTTYFGSFIFREMKHSRERELLLLCKSPQSPFSSIIFKYFYLICNLPFLTKFSDNPMGWAEQV